MIFDWNACCAVREVRELQGEAPLTLEGDGLWVGVLSSGRCLLAAAGQNAGSGASGDILLGRGGFTLQPATPCHLLCLRMEGLAVEEFLRGLPRPRFADSAACPNAAEQLARLCSAPAESDAPDPALGAAPYALLCALAHADEEARRLSPLVAEAVETIRNNYMALYGVEDLADALGESKCHLVRTFSAEMGVSPGKYLTRTRLEAAKLVAQYAENRKGERGLGVEQLEGVDQIRLRLEGLATAMCCQRIGQKELVELDEIVTLQEFYVSRDLPDKILESDSRFHTAIYAACGSRVFDKQLTGLLKRLMRHRKLSVSDNQRAQKSTAEHRAIFNALAAGDAAQAEVLATQHVERARDNILINEQAAAI